MREYALMVLRFETLYKTVFENRLVRYFLRFIPSLQELVLLGKILFHMQEKHPDGRPVWSSWWRANPWGGPRRSPSSRWPTGPSWSASPTIGSRC